MTGNRDSEEGEPGWEEVDIKNVSIVLKGHRKTRGFINLLLRNRENLGIRRLAEKHDQKRHSIQNE